MGSGQWEIVHLSTSVWITRRHNVDIVDKSGEGGESGTAPRVCSAWTVFAGCGMVRALVGDLFQSDAQTLVNAVNCAGVMGKGVAREFKKRYPEMYRDYAERCRRKQVLPGEPYLFRRLHPPNILNFPTKNHWRSASKLDDIVAGLEYLERHYREWGIRSLAVPALGCGHSQLEWRVVGPVLFRHLSRLDIPVELYAPVGTPPGELDVEFCE